MTEGRRNTIRPNPNRDWPEIDPTAYIDPTAQVIGNVHIGPEVFIGPNAVIRADESDDKGQVYSIDIGAQCNIQDGVIIHALGGTHVTIGNGTSLAHGSIVHGPCIIGQGCFIGFRTVVYNATLENGVFVNAGAVIQGVILVENAFVPVAAAIATKEAVTNQVSTASPADCEFMTKVVNANLALANGYIDLNEKESNMENV